MAAERTPAVTVPLRTVPVTTLARWVTESDTASGRRCGELPAANCLNATVGRCRTMSTQVTESRYKSTVKTKARKTNNHASFGGSLLQNNMEVEAAIELARHLDETGSRQVRTGFAPGVTEPKKPCSGSLGSHHSNRPFLVCIKFASGSCRFNLVYTEFVHGLL
jgi:hypothetical protein